MGTDKATLHFAGLPLIAHAVEKLRPLCASVTILGDRPDLQRYAETLPDRLPGNGPLGGIDAALAHTQHDWLIILPVDLPLLPAPFLQAWAEDVLADPNNPAAACFEVEGRLQPLVSLLHRELATHLRVALSSGQRRVTTVLQNAAEEAAGKGTRRTGLRINPAEHPDWFANLNTSQDLARAEQALTESAAKVVPPPASPFDRIL